MFLKSFLSLLSSCRYQSVHRELYLLFGKALIGANLLWLMGNIVSSHALGIAAHSAEVLIFYVFFSCIMGIVATIVIKRFVSKVHLSLSELFHQCRAAFIVQLLYAAGLMIIVSLPCVFAVFAKALRSIPLIGYFFRQVYEAIEPLFMLSLSFVFLAAVLLPLITPFILLLVKQPLQHWKDVLREKVHPRIAASLSPLLAAYVLWIIVECVKCMIEWFFPVGGLLSALIRSILYTAAELFVFWASLKCFFEAARSNVK
jgi:hypothetical protein